MGQIAVENKMQLGQLLLARGIVTPEQIDKALAEQKEKGHRKLLGRASGRDELLHRKPDCIGACRGIRCTLCADWPQNLRPENCRNAAA